MQAIRIVCPEAKLYQASSSEMFGNSIDSDGFQRESTPLTPDKLIVAINSDQWLINKKGKFFMPFSERKNIISNLEVVDEVIDFEDDEDGSCALGLEKIKNLYPNYEIIFCNGGDRKEDNIPEMKVQNITFKFGVGGDNKMNSSSAILKDWNFSSEREYGVSSITCLLIMH